MSVVAAYGGRAVVRVTDRFTPTAIQDRDGGALTDTSDQQVAGRLLALADDPRFSSRADDLRTLSADIADPEGDAWSAVNLFSAFPAESVVSLRHRNLVERVAGVVAGVSVFLPVGWTWWGFHDAASAYEQMLVEEGEPEGTTFLALWATGFGGRLEGWHLLVPMALVSLVLIGFAISSLVFHRMVAGVNIRREEEKALSARSDLASCLTHAQIVLDKRRADHPLRIEGIVKSSMEKLDKAHSATKKAVTNLADTSERVSAGMTEMVSVLETAGHETGKVLAQTEQAMSTLTGAVSQTESAVASSLGKLDESVSGSVERANVAMAASGRQLAQDLEAALRSFESAMSSSIDSFTAEAVGEVNRAGASLQQVVDHIGSSAKSNADAATQLTEQVSAMADDNRTAREELERSLDDLRSTLEGIELALARHEGSLQGQVSELTAARDAAERMLRRLTARTEQQPSLNGSGA
jgi:hypothetical protein